MIDTVLVTQEDPFYIPVFVRSLLNSIDEDEVRVSRVVLLRPFDETTFELAQRMYRFYGLKNFLRRGVSYTVRKVADAVGMGAYSARAVAERNDIPVEQRDTVNSDSFIETLEDTDVVLSAASPEIFDEKLLQAPNWGCLNVHTAELPKYRGMMPAFWALYHGEEEVGVTVHTMTEEIDRGKAVKRDSFTVREDDTHDDVARRGKVYGGQAAADALTDIAREEVTVTDISGDGSYFSFPTREERGEFQQRGGKLL